MAARSWDKDRANSQYFFEIHLRVSKTLTFNNVIYSLTKALKSVASPNSIYITSAKFDYAYAVG